MSEKLQRDHFVDIEALKEELAKVKSAGAKKLLSNSLHFYKVLIRSGAESMQKMERRFSKTLLKMSKKFLSLEEDIKNISCEGTVSFCKIPSLSDASASRHYSTAVVMDFS